MKVDLAASHDLLRCRALSTGRYLARSCFEELAIHIPVAGFYGNFAGVAGRVRWLVVRLLLDCLRLCLVSCLFCGVISGLCFH